MASAHAIDTDGGPTRSAAMKIGPIACILSTATAFVTGWILASRAPVDYVSLVPSSVGEPTKVLLSWDQCNDYFWPSGNAPDWGCLCKMAPTTPPALFDYRSTGPFAPTGVAVSRFDGKLLKKAKRKDYALASRRAATKDEPVLTHDAFVFNRRLPKGERLRQVSALVDGPRTLNLSLRSHGLPLECPNGEGGENTHYWEGIAEMINHSPNATTTVCAEAFEVVPAWQTVTRYIMQLCATRDLKPGWEMTCDYQDWAPTGAIQRGARRSRSWIAEMLSRSTVDVVSSRVRKVARSARAMAQGLDRP